MKHTKILIPYLYQKIVYTYAINYTCKQAINMNFYLLIKLALVSPITSMIVKSVPLHIDFMWHENQKVTNLSPLANPFYSFWWKTKHQNKKNTNKQKHKIRWRRGKVTRQRPLGKGVHVTYFKSWSISNCSLGEKRWLLLSLNFTLCFRNVICHVIMLIRKVD